jgi:CubicO group peptidase (beta-lactamase class C family)
LSCTQSFGTTALKDGTTPNEHSLFEIGSISKVFTGILLADRVGKGKMKLENPVENYLPDSVTVPERAGKKILVRQLSTHTSGLPRMPSNINFNSSKDPFAAYDETLLYEYLSNHKLERDIGSEALYSNLAVGTLGHIMSREAGTPYEALIKENICRPLGLSNTTISMTEDQRSRLAMPHSRGLNDHIWHFDCLAGAGAIRSTASDMLQFLAANAFPEGSLEDAIKLSQQVHGEQKLGKAQVGLGWIIAERDSSTVLLHDGATGGYRAFAAVIKGPKRAVVVFTNSTTDVTDIALSILRGEKAWRTLKPSLRALIINEIKENGLNKGIKLYKQHEKEKTPGFAFSANQLNQVAYYFLQTGDHETANKILEKNQKLYPKDINVLLALGDVAADEGQLEKAESFYRQALDKRKNHARALQKLEEIGVEVGETP